MNKIKTKLYSAKLHRGFSIPIRPHVHWKYMIFGVAIFLVISAIYAYFIFRKVDLNDNIEPSGAVKVLEKAKLERVLNYFGERKAIEENLKNGTYSFPDPSI